MNRQIIGLEEKQINQATETLVNAFNKDPIFDYLLSHTKSKKDETSRILWSVTLRYAQKYNQIYTTPEIKGIAAWIPPGEYPINFVRMLQSGLYQIPFLIGFTGLKKSLPLFSFFEKYHKQDMHQPHWYLFALGVSEAHQGEGIGSLLIQPILERADKENLPCYLETSTEKAVRFYQRNGFEIIRNEESPVKFWTMKREAIGERGKSG
ncbi:MAG: GNAT family N-acetyltransferase [Cyanobacteriota bacterium]|nr:GNAT family N-acetyltransferase [Cyanobacteriota bacterium]